MSMVAIVLSALSAEAAKPNIVLVVADDQGHAQVGYHNKSTHTPRIDELAAQGVKLENYYVQVSAASPPQALAPKPSPPSPPPTQWGAADAHRRVEPPSPRCACPAGLQPHA